MGYDNIFKTDKRLERAIIGGGIYGSGPKSKKKCPPTMRNKIRKRWWKNKHVGECFCCGRKNLDFEDAQIGRIKAGAYGGIYSPENCRIVCGECNRGMSKTNMKVYMKRTYPERYKKYFPKDEKKETKKRSRRKVSSSYNFGNDYQKRLRNILR